MAPAKRGFACVVTAFHHPSKIMIFTKSKYHAIAAGLFACAAGSFAIVLGDHHIELVFKALVVMGVALVLVGLFLLRYSWVIRSR